MLSILSPAKKLDFETPAPVSEHSVLTFAAESQSLANQLKKLSREELGGLMKLSDKLTELNYNRYRQFKQPFTPDNAKQAVYMFQGDTYVGLNAETIAPKDVPFLQGHIRILSGLYGLLKPLDLIQPYRLEMGTKLKNEKNANLYDFWGSKLTDHLNKETENHKDRTVINLASNEYISAIQPKNLKGGMITPVFKEIKNGKPKMIGLFAKRARGMMARFIVENKIDTPTGLKDFNMDGYRFEPKGSDEEELLFLRG